VKFLLVFVFTVLNLNAIEILVSNVNIKYKEHLNYDNLFLSNTHKKVRCTIFDKENLKKNTYEAKHYIMKNKPICNKDVKVSINNKIRYDFGNIVIERSGEVIVETKNYIKVKNNDGTVDKIYKNGQYK